MTGLRIEPTTQSTVREVKCATDGCSMSAECRVEAGGVGSYYCWPCVNAFRKVANKL